MCACFFHPLSLPRPIFSTHFWRQQRGCMVFFVFVNQRSNSYKDCRKLKLSNPDVACSPSFPLFLNGFLACYLFSEAIDFLISWISFVMNVRPHIPNFNKGKYRNRDQSIEWGELSHGETASVKILEGGHKRDAKKMETKELEGHPYVIISEEDQHESGICRRLTSQWAKHVTHEVEFVSHAESSSCVFLPCVWKKKCWKFNGSKFDVKIANWNTVKEAGILLRRLYADDGREKSR